MKGLIPVIHFHRFDRCHRSVNSRIRKYDIQTAPFGCSLIYSLFYLLRLFNITLDYNGLSARLLYLPFYLFGIIGRPVKHNHLRAVSGKFENRGLTDSGTAAGYDRYFAC
ncbi:hypothetical protein D3C75_401910 [compost metagenome]